MIPDEGEFTVGSLNVSTAKGTKKMPVDSVVLRAGWGIEGDAHAGEWHRQVSLLADEDVDGMRAVLPTIAPATSPRTSRRRASRWPSCPSEPASRSARPCSR